MSIQPQTPTERKPVHISTLFQQNKLFKWNTKKTPTLLVGKALSHTLSSLDPTLTSNTQPSTLPLTKSSDSIAIRVAAFDIDGTLIHTKTNSPFPKSGSDWRWKYECIPDHLTQLSNNGYQVCFFSNQKGMSLGKGKRKQWFMQKMETIGTLLKGGFEVYAAIENDLYRKPNTGMWTEYSRGKCVDLIESFYVGDAAGRKGDHSDCDLAFAKAVGLPFYTPEMYFLDAPSEILDTEVKELSLYLGSPTFEFKPSSSQEIVVIVGYPCSGKSTLAKRFMKEYAWINQDTLKTIKQCLKETIIAIESGRSCVIDKTNPDINTRRLFIDLAIERGVKVRCIELLTPIHVCLHNNIYRCLKSDRKEVPRIAFSMFKKRYEKPSLEEGFASIEVLEFSANFECKDDEAEWLSARKI